LVIHEVISERLNASQGESLSVHSPNDAAGFGAEGYIYSFFLTSGLGNWSMNGSGVTAEIGYCRRQALYE
jgi:hypothetical protein